MDRATMPLAGKVCRPRNSGRRHDAHDRWDGTGMTKIIVDGNEIDVPPEYTLLQACEAAGAEVPRFSFHERLSMGGYCRVCRFREEPDDARRDDTIHTWTRARTTTRDTVHVRATSV